MTKGPLRILHVIRSIDPRGGGPAEGLKHHIKIRHQQGIQTSVAILDDQKDDINLPGSQLIYLGRGFGKYGFHFGVEKALKKLATHHDIAVIDGLWNYHSLAARNAFANQLPYAVFPHGMLDPWFNRTYPLKALKKKLYWNLGDFKVLRDASAVCFTTQTEQLLARESFKPYRAREVVVGYGVSSAPPDSLTLREAFLGKCPHVSGHPYLLFLSRIQEKKGCDLLIDAFTTIANTSPDLHLVMAGPDESNMVYRMQKQIAQAGLSKKVHWPGMLLDNAKWGAFYGAEAFCLPSHQENFGIAVTEALACGIPVLISDQVNIWSEILAHEAGLVAPDTQEGTRDLLRHWVETDTTTRQKMRHAALHCFNRHFEIHQAVENLLTTLQKIVDGHLPPQWKIYLA